MTTLFDPALVAVCAVRADAALRAFVRLALGESLPDRVVALDLVASVGVAMCGVYAVLFERPVFLDVALLLAVISFIGTVGFARYLERRGQR